MTLHEVTSQLYSLSLGGWFNHEKFSKKGLENYIRKLSQGTLALGNRLVMEIALPDGWFYFMITRWRDAPDGWDYYIPDTRAESDRLIEMLVSKEA